MTRASTGLTMRSMVAVAARPDLWLTALRQYRRLLPSTWWRRRPYLPVPDRRYAEFRLQTQYGTSPDAPAGPARRDVVTYLEWCRRQHRS